MMKLFRAIIMFFALTSVTIATNADAEEILQAQYTNPVDRYGHFALGRPHEYASLIAMTSSGRELIFNLPENEVFEDLTPRIITLAEGEAKNLLTIVSQRDSGSRLMVLRLNDGHLEISAQSPAIGTPMRWMNPVGVADLDGDGSAEVAAVITPHIGGILKIYRKQGNDLVEISSHDGFSNHQYRTAELSLSTPILIDGKMRLLVPDSTRQSMRFVGLENGRLVETGRCHLPAPVTGPITMKSPSEVTIGLLSGQQVTVPKDCPESSKR